jgi:hypothetical protein
MLSPVQGNPQVALAGGGSSPEMPFIYVEGGQAVFL